MRIVCVGGGPAGLYFAISAKLHDKNSDITVLERNQLGVTYGWGVTFSDSLLDSLYRNDQDSAREINDGPEAWRNQEVRVGAGRPVHLGGYGYAIGRHRLLDILTRRALALGVEVRFGQEVRNLSAVAGADLVVACDGANSRVRRLYPDHFQVQAVRGRNKYIWLGTHKVFESFVYGFEPTVAGWIWFYAYRSSIDATTVVVECSPETWEGLGFDRLAAQEGLQVLEDIFKRHLDGYPLLLNAAAHGTTLPWANFVRTTNARWYHDNVALMGDAAHTTHFSIGSGTTLAIQDAIVLADELAGHDDLSAALSAYQNRRVADLAVPHAAAVNSATWFENLPRHIDEDATQFAYDLWRRRSNPPMWRYHLHLATQIETLRKVRSSLSATVRKVRARRRLSFGDFHQPSPPAGRLR